MEDRPRIAVIGAGIAGLTCARELTAAGLAPVVFEKGRGLGGRLATRRTAEGAQFDHGAQFITARDPAFRQLMETMARAGDAASWFHDKDEPHWVGRPRMSRIGHHLGADLHIRSGCRVEAVTRKDAQWCLTLDDETHTFDQVVITAPAPQAIELLGPDHPLAAPLGEIRYAPCHTLMVTTDGNPHALPDRLYPENGPFSLVARDSSKPGRPSMPCWVAHTSPEWSTSHLETEHAAVLEELLPAFCETTGVAPEQIVHTEAHRWRYARVTRALGQACLEDETGTLRIAGDGCLGPRVEAAWQSGQAAARALRASL